MSKTAKPAAAGNSLFDRRLLIVAGKGGVGKTTVACALGLIASKLGKRTLLAEVDGVGRAAQLLGAHRDAIGSAVEVQPGLCVMPVEGSAALAEYLELIVPVKRVLSAVFSSRIYQYFVAAAPGLKELMTIGKIWYEAERLDEATGKRMWDIVILDAPATGHSLQYLGMPIAAHEVFRSGLVGRESQRLVDLLTDPVRTSLNLVTTAEEMPVNETAEMYQKVQSELRIPLGHLFVNRTHTTDLTEADLDLLADPVAVLDKHDQLLLGEVGNRAREELGWAAINQTYLQRLKTEVQLPMAEIPFFFTEEFGVEQIRQIATRLETTLLHNETRKRRHISA